MASPVLRPLGRNGPSVNAIGFGAMSIGGVYGAAGTDAERFALLDRAVELGITFWDSADVYAGVDELLGKWFARTGLRSKIFLATKFGIKVDAAYNTTLDSSPAYVRASCEKALKSLGTDYIDLYYCHRVDGVTPVEKTVEAMAALQKEGKIRHLGISEASAATIRRAHAASPLAAVQLEYSPFCLDIEHNDVLATCRALGVAVVAYSPMGRGLLTGVKTYDDVKADPFLSGIPKMSEANFPKIQKLVEVIKKVAERKGVSAAQATLAWVLAQGEDVIVIPGTRRVKYLEENMGAGGVELGGEDVKEIREAAEAAELVGGRYPDIMGEEFVNGETPALS